MLATALPTCACGSRRPEAAHVDAPVLEALLVAAADRVEVATSDERALLQRGERALEEQLAELLHE